MTELRAQLDTLERTLAEIDNGTMSPQYYLGYKGSKKEAKRVIEADIKKWKQKIEEAEKTAFSTTEKSKNNEGDPFGEAFPEFTGKPEQAIEHLLKVKKGYVPGAFHKEGLGAIDLVWGDSSMGLQHIIERRNEQGMNGVEFTKRIPQIIASGKVEPDEGDLNKRVIISEKEKAVIKLTWDEKKRVWLVSAFPTYEKVAPGSGRTPDLNQTYDDRSTPPSNQNNENLTSPPTFVNDLNDILAGKYDGDTAKIIELLEHAIDEAEKQDKMAEYDTLLNDASNRLTELLAREAQ